MITFRGLKKATKQFVQEIISDSKEDKLTTASSKIQQIQINNNHCLDIEKKIKELNKKIVVFTNARERVQNELESLKLQELDVDAIIKNSQLKAQIKRQIESIDEDLNPLIFEKKELEKQYEEIKVSLLKDQADISKKFKSELIFLKEKKERSNQFISTMELNYSLEEVFDNFVLLVFEIKDQFPNKSIVGDNITAIYESDGIVEARINLQSETYVVSICNESVLIGKLLNNEIVSIGTGECFSHITWENDLYNNQFLRKLYHQLKLLQRRLKQSKERVLTLQLN